MRSTLQSKREASSPVAAILIEPTNAQSGHVASAGFIRELMKLARENDAALIVDEQGTGCGASGAGFWQSNQSADYVTFGRRTQVSGYFSKDQGKPSDISLGGSRLGLLQLQAIVGEINSRQLIQNVASVGSDMQH